MPWAQSPTRSRHRVSSSFVSPLQRVLLRVRRTATDTGSDDEIKSSPPIHNQGRDRNAVKRCCRGGKHRVISDNSSPSGIRRVSAYFCRHVFRAFLFPRFQQKRKKQRTATAATSKCHGGTLIIVSPSALVNVFMTLTVRMSCSTS